MPDEELNVTSSEEAKEYTCVRCGFKYHKTYDYEPFLCYRCIRFMAKKNWTIVHTIQPAIAVPDKGDV